MSPYVPFIIWTVSILICHWIATRRGARPNLFWRLFAIILGPFAIPFAFLIKPESSPTDQG
jgi:hypothetical protein